jgi:tetratricopeptide (TPR) repeat protein
MSALAAETTLTAASPRSRVLHDIRSDVERGHQLVLSGDHSGAVRAYQSARNRIFRLLHLGGPDSLAGLSHHFGPPHDVAHLKELVRAGCTLMADLVPGVPEPPVLDTSFDPNALGGFGEAARTLPRAGEAKESQFAGAALLSRTAFDAGDYELAMKRYAGAADLAANEPNAHAALLLNAGAAAVQAGRLREANRFLSQALEGFQQTDDALGTAQAAHNLAIASAASGDADRAAGAFKETDERARAAAGAAGVAAEVLRSLGRTDGTGSRFPVREADTRRAAASARPGGGDISAVIGRGATVILRDPMAPTTWSNRPLAGSVEQRDRDVVYSAGITLGTQIDAISWRRSAAPSVDAVISAAYETRLAAASHADLRAVILSDVDVSVQLGHLYYYVIPVGLAEAYAGLGEWSQARTWLYRAADYPYLNKAVEGPALWLRIAQTHLGEGDTAYRDDDFAAALTAYAGVVALDGTAGDAAVYTHPALTEIGALVAALLADPATLPPDLDPGIGAVVLDIAAKVSQLSAGLDWFGIPASMVPPFTFDYLQNASRFLAQQAQAAERDFMQFMERYDSGKLTRLQVQQAAAAASADEAVAKQQAVAAQEEVDLAQTARALADLRHDNAQQARSAYGTMSREQIRLETEMAWYSSQNSWELNNPIPGDGRDIHEVIAADRHRLGVISRDYELLRMQQNINELAISEQQANDQVALSVARRQAAVLSAQAASLRRAQAQQLAAAFEDSFFTPEVWKQLADFMRAQAQRYLYWATRVARLMERAYEFDYDTTVNRVRTDYSAGVVNGMLGSDQLLADIDYFTYDRITRTTHKTVRASLEVSLAERFPFAFAGFRQHGEIAFNTLLDDLERDYPGSFNHRIQSVEVDVVGLVPSQGLRGTLTNSGISQYRALDGTVKWRLQNIDTMLLSSYARDDAMMFRPRPEQLNVFEGVGMASGWTLRYPPDVNDVDYRFLVDVRVTFHVEAQFDRALAAAVEAAPTPPEALRATTSFSLRNDLPDRFFLLTSQGTAALTIGPEHLPHHHLDPKVRSISLQLLSDADPRPAVPLTVTVPGGASADVTPDGDGRVPSDDPALAPLTGATLRGDWALATTADTADRATVHDVLLFVEYDFTPREAA